MSIKKLRFNTIRSKLIISFILICLIPLIIVGNVFLFKSMSILDRKLQLTSLQTLNEVNFGLNNYFISMEAFTNSMATNNSFVHIDEADNLTFAKELLKSVKESHGDILSTYVGTESGKYANYPVQKMADNYDATKRPWYMEAKANVGKIILTLPYKDAATNKIVVSCAKAIENNGKFIGVVSMDISVDILTKQISSQAIGSTGYLFMCDTTGNVIAHPDNSLIGTNYSSKLSFWNEINSKDKGFTSFKDENGKNFVFYETNKITGWKTITIMDSTELTADVYSVLYIILTAILIMLIISIIMSILLSKGISLNIKNLKEVYSKVSQGDFSVSIETKSKDEFKDLANDFNLMIHNISSLMEKIKSSSKIVFETSSTLANMAEESTVSISEVSKAIGEVSQGAVNQAESAQHGAAQIQELSSELDVIIQGNTEMDKLSATTQDLSSKGLSMVKELIEKSNKTKSSTAEVFEIVLDMDKSTARINDISNTISAITAQTNLLSLNASIEAARAGEAGRGFSVVADEIRKLADQSKNSTEEIKAIIETIQSKSQTAVNAIESTESIVIEQENAVKETQEIFTRIINAISAITENVKQISTSVGYVTSKKETVQDQIQNISSISEETAASSQQVSASSEELNVTMGEFTQCAEDLQNLSQHLEEEVEKFKTR